MSQVEKEIREQPEALSRLLKEGRESADEVGARVRSFSPRFVVIAARGSSDNAARYAQYLFGAHNRLPVCLATPSLFSGGRSSKDSKASSMRGGSCCSDPANGHAPAALDSSAKLAAGCSGAGGMA